MTFNLQLGIPESRVGSVKYQLSKWSWRRGISNFFTEDVPFSWSTSGAFSDMVSSYLMVLMAHYDSNKCVNCYEVGAGLGRVSSNVLSYLKRQKKLDRVRFYVSDSESTIVDALSSHDAFSAYQDRVQFSQMSFDNLQFSDESPPHFLVLSYVFDALPHCHLVWHDGEIKEEKVITLLNGQPLLDTSVSPFRVISSEDIPDWVAEADDAVILQHLSRLNGCFDETMSLESPEGLSLDEIKLIEAFCQSQCMSSFKFNYSKPMVTGLKTLFENAPETCLWLIQDVGDSSCESSLEQESLTVSFGACLFFKINFPFITYIAKQMGFNVRCTSFCNGDTQFLIIYRGISESELYGVVSQTMTTPFATRELEVATQFNALSLSHEGQTFYKEAVAQWRQLPHAYQRSYYVMLSLARHCFHQQLYAESIRYATELVTDYGDFAISAKLLLGQSYIALQQYEESAVILQQAITSAPFVSELYFQLSISLAHIQRYDDFLVAVNNYMTHTGNTFVWRHILTFIIILFNFRGNKLLAQEYLKAVSHISTLDQFSVPQDVLDSMASLELLPTTVAD